MKNRIYLVAMMLWMNLSAFYGQTVNGIVTEQNGDPVIGAAVKISGTSVGTVTDFDGNFSIDAEPNARIEISYMGFVGQTILVSDLVARGGKVTLVEDSKALEEVVVIGMEPRKNQL